MAKNLDFQDYSAVVTDADGDEHESTVRAAVITDELVYLKDMNGNNVRREVPTPTGARQVSVGDVFVETERAGVYDYLTADAWASTGYGGAGAEAETPARTTRGKRSLPDGADS
ncbi:MAG TPA: hypothetical protein VIY48_13830 [Candidatus Paceibacterota bacterium]